MSEHVCTNTHMHVHSCGDGGLCGGIYVCKRRENHTVELDKTSKQDRKTSDRRGGRLCQAVCRHKFDSAVSPVPETM